ncbi:MULTISPECIES: hypothetical protein [Streptomyces]|uniref:Uncharacterized protein n=1 Tax=Streptomyces mordarskii TaxID=1226758 RepID=A0ABN1DJ83_9ACTN
MVLTAADREELVRVTTTGVHPASVIRRTQHLGVQGVVDTAEHDLVAECGRHGVAVQEKLQAAQPVTACERLVERLPEQRLLVHEDTVRNDLHLLFSHHFR